MEKNSSIGNWIAENLPAIFWKLPETLAAKKN